MFLKFPDCIGFSDLSRLVYFNENGPSLGEKTERHEVETEQAATGIDQVRNRNAERYARFDKGQMARATVLTVAAERKKKDPRIVAGGINPANRDLVAQDHGFSADILRANQEALGRLNTMAADYRQEAEAKKKEAKLGDALPLFRLEGTLAQLPDLKAQEQQLDDEIKLDESTLEQQKTAIEETVGRDVQKENAEYQALAQQVTDTAEPIRVARELFAKTDKERNDAGIALGRLKYDKAEPLSDKDDEIADTQQSLQRHQSALETARTAMGRDPSDITLKSDFEEAQRLVAETEAALKIAQQERATLWKKVSKSVQGEITKAEKKLAAAEAARKASEADLDTKAAAQTDLIARKEVAYNEYTAISRVAGGRINADQTALDRELAAKKSQSSTIQAKIKTLEGLTTGQNKDVLEGYTLARAYARTHAVSFVDAQFEGLTGDTVHPTPLEALLAEFEANGKKPSFQEWTVMPGYELVFQTNFQSLEKALQGAQANLLQIKDSGPILHGLSEATITIIPDPKKPTKTQTIPNPNNAANRSKVEAYRTFLEQQMGTYKAYQEYLLSVYQHYVVADRMAGKPDVERVPDYKKYLQAPAAPSVAYLAPALKDAPGVSEIQKDAVTAAALKEANTFNPADPKGFAAFKSAIDANYTATPLAFKPLAEWKIPEHFETTVQTHLSHIETDLATAESNRTAVEALKARPGASSLQTTAAESYLKYLNETQIPALRGYQKYLFDVYRALALVKRVQEPVVDPDRNPTKAVEQYSQQLDAMKVESDNTQAFLDKAASGSPLARFYKTKKDVIDGVAKKASIFNDIKQRTSQTAYVELAKQAMHGEALNQYDQAQLLMEEYLAVRKWFGETRRDKNPSDKNPTFESLSPQLQERLIFAAMLSQNGIRDFEDGGPLQSMIDMDAAIQAAGKVAIEREIPAVTPFRDKYMVAGKAYMEARAQLARMGENASVYPVPIRFNEQDYNPQQFADLTETNTSDYRSEIDIGSLSAKLTEGSEAFQLNFDDFASKKAGLETGINNLAARDETIAYEWRDSRVAYGRNLVSFQSGLDLVFDAIKTQPVYDLVTARQAKEAVAGLLLDFGQKSFDFESELIHFAINPTVPGKKDVLLATYQIYLDYIEDLVSKLISYKNVLETVLPRINQLQQVQAAIVRDASESLKRAKVEGLRQIIADKQSILRDGPNSSALSPAQRAAWARLDQESVRPADAKAAAVRLLGFTGFETIEALKQANEKGRRTHPDDYIRVQQEINRYNFSLSQRVEMLEHQSKIERTLASAERVERTAKDDFDSFLPTAPVFRKQEKEEAYIKAKALLAKAQADSRAVESALTSLDYIINAKPAKDTPDGKIWLCLEAEEMADREVRDQGRLSNIETTLTNATSDVGRSVDTELSAAQWKALGVSDKEAWEALAGGGDKPGELGERQLMDLGEGLAQVSRSLNVSMVGAFDNYFKKGFWSDPRLNPANWKDGNTLKMTVVDGAPDDSTGKITQSSGETTVAYAVLSEVMNRTEDNAAFLEAIKTPATWEDPANKKYHSLLDAIVADFDARTVDRKQEIVRMAEWKDKIDRGQATVTEKVGNVVTTAIDKMFSSSSTWQERITYGAITYIVIAKGIFSGNSLIKTASRLVGGGVVAAMFYEQQTGKSALGVGGVETPHENSKGTVLNTMAMESGVDRNDKAAWKAHEILQRAKVEDVLDWYDHREEWGELTAAQRKSRSAEFSLAKSLRKNGVLKGSNLSSIDPNAETAASQFEKAVKDELVFFGRHVMRGATASRETLIQTGRDYLRGSFTEEGVRRNVGEILPTDTDAQRAEKERFIKVRGGVKFTWFDACSAHLFHTNLQKAAENEGGLPWLKSSFVSLFDEVWDTTKGVYFDVRNVSKDKYDEFKATFWKEYGQPGLEAIKEYGQKGWKFTREKADELTVWWKDSPDALAVRKVGDNMWEVVTTGAKYPFKAAFLGTQWGSVKLRDLLLRAEAWRKAEMSISHEKPITVDMFPDRGGVLLNPANKNFKNGFLHMNRVVHGYDVFGRFEPDFYQSVIDGSRQYHAMGILANPDFMTKPETRFKINPHEGYVNFVGVGLPPDNNDDAAFQDAVQHLVAFLQQPANLKYIKPGPFRDAILAGTNNPNALRDHVLRYIDRFGAFNTSKNGYLTFLHLPFPTNESNGNSYYQETYLDVDPSPPHNVNRVQRWHSARYARRYEDMLKREHQQDDFESYKHSITFSVADALASTSKVDIFSYGLIEWKFDTINKKKVKVINSNGHYAQKYMELLGLWHPNELDTFFRNALQYADGKSIPYGEKDVAADGLYQIIESNASDFLDRHGHAQNEGQLYARIAAATAPAGAPAPAADKFRVYHNNLGDYLAGNTLTHEFKERFGSNADFLKEYRLFINKKLSKLARDSQPINEAAVNKATKEFIAENEGIVIPIFRRLFSATVGSAGQLGGGLDWLLDKIGAPKAPAPKSIP